MRLVVVAGLVIDLALMVVFPVLAETDAPLFFNLHLVGEFRCIGPYQEQRLSRDVLAQVLEAHDRWLTHRLGSGGQRANLCHADLTGIDLRKAGLGRSNLSMAQLKDVNFAEADLFMA